MRSTQRSLTTWIFSLLCAPDDMRALVLVVEDDEANRVLLAQAMRKRNFRSYDKEWWHFTLRHEPFPQTYFDFPVR